MEPPLPVFSAEEVDSVLNAAQENEPPALPMVYSCYTCGYRCDTPNLLEVHRRRQHPQKPRYLCRYCKYSTNHRHHITAHERIHTTERPFECKVCGKSFGWLRSLTRHLPLHKGKESHRCPDCGRSYTHSSSVTRHRKRQTPGATCPPVQCLDCALTFSHVDDLETHYLTHREEEP